MKQENDILDRTKAGKGLNPWEAIQLSAALDLPLSTFGLKDTPDNRKKLTDLKEEFDAADKIGAIIDIVA
jgi:hypothetical protein